MEKTHTHTISSDLSKLILIHSDPVARRQLLLLKSMEAPILPLGAMELDQSQDCLRLFVGLKSTSTKTLEISKIPPAL